MTRKIQEMRSVYWTLSPIYYIVRIFGLSPYSVVVKNNCASWSVSRSPLLYNIFFLVIVLLCLLPFIGYIEDTVHIGKQDKMAMYSEFFTRVSGILIAILCVILSLVNRYETCKLMKTMDDFDLDLKSYGIEVDYKQTQQDNRNMVVAVCSLFSISVVIGLIVRLNLTGEKSILYWFASILLLLVNYLTLVQFVGFVLVLRKRFSMLNQYCKTINKPKNAKNFKNSLTSRSTLQKQTTWRILNTQDTSIKSSGRVTCIGATNAIKYRTHPVSIMCDFHDRLCEWGKKLNSLYSIQILCTTGMASVVVVINLYIFYLMLSKNENYKLTFFVAWKPAVWGIWFFSMTFLMSYVCAKTRDEANEVSVSLHRINFDLNDEESRTHIEIFSLQMQHQKLNFLAGGFFVVDLCSLRTIMATVTTYLVFFIQFEMAARNGGTVKTSL